MPASIHVQGGFSNGKGYQVIDAVFRVGTGPNCNLRLKDAGILPHMLTVEFRNGQYFVHNRTPTTIAMSGRAFAPNTALPWQAHDFVQLTPQVALRMVIDGDPAPCKSIAPVKLSGFGIEPAPQPDAATATAPAKSASQGSKTGQIVFIVFLAVAAVGLIAYKLFEPDPTAIQQEVKDEFADLVAQLQARGKRDPRAERMLLLLQAARAAERRGEAAATAARYSELLLALRAMQSSDGGFADDSDTHVYEKTLKYVTRRLRTQESAEK